MPPSDDDARFLREKLGFYATSPAERGWQGAFGADRERESGASEGAISFAPGFDVSTSYDIERVTTGLFAEATAPVGERLALNAALRRDDSEAAGARTTGRVAARYRLGSAGTSLRASWAEGFKLPSLFSLGHPLVGNPDLKPERTRAIELALESGASGDGVRWQISAFAQHFRDLIDFDFESFMSVNRSRVDASGLELEVGYTAQRWNLAAHATALDVSVIGSSEPLNQRPERLAAVSGGWRVAPALELFAAWRYVGARYDSSIPTGRERLSGFARWDLSLGWQTSPQVRLSLALDNALDEAYETAIGFPDPGRVVRIGVRYRSN